MDWEIIHMIENVDRLYDEEKDELTMQCQVPEAAGHFRQLLDGATQATLDFHGGEWEGQSVIGFRLRNANGEFYLALRKKDWEALLEQPDEIAFLYGSGEKDRFQVTFLNWMFERFLDDVIERYNEGEKTLLTKDIVEVFGEEDE